MRNERLEPPVVYPGQVEDRVAAVAGSNGTETLLVDIRLFCHVIDGIKVILHVFAAVIARDLFAPGASEA